MRYTAEDFHQPTYQKFEFNGHDIPLRLTNISSDHVLLTAPILEQYTFRYDTDETPPFLLASEHIIGLSPVILTGEYASFDIVILLPEELRHEIEVHFTSRIRTMHGLEPAALFITPDMTSPEYNGALVTLNEYMICDILRHMGPSPSYNGSSYPRERSLHLPSPPGYKPSLRKIEGNDAELAVILWGCYALNKDNADLNEYNVHDYSQRIGGFNVWLKD